jgi:cytochrome c biogenesis protein CcmG, thiol:disulfide interchange protein DsbE
VSEPQVAEPGGEAASARSNSEAAGQRGREAAGQGGGEAPGFITRIGLAIARPRWALAVAADRRAAGRSGSDLIALIPIVLVAAQLRLLAGAVWLGGAIDLGLGFGAVTRILTSTLVHDLSFLVVGALILWLGAGPRRNLGRAFDLACVAVIPLFVVGLAVAVIGRALEAPLPEAVVWIVTQVARGWSGVLFALAWRPARLAPPITPAPPPAVARPARLAGWAVIAVAVLSVALHTVWIVRNLDLIRPVQEDEPAPTFSLPAIGPGGQPGEPFTFGRGKVTVLDFWATWCGPCIKAMPKLEALAARHPEVDVLAINVDDAAAARAMFEQHGYTKLRLLADDGVVSRRYNVTSYPHTVVVDRNGVVRHIVRGASNTIDAAVRSALFRK